MSSAAAAGLFPGLRPRRHGQKLLPAVVAAKVERLAIAFGAERGGFVHGHSADRVFAHGFRFFHGHVSLFVVVIELGVLRSRCSLRGTDTVTPERGDAEKVESGAHACAVGLNRPQEKEERGNGAPHRGTPQA